MWRPPSLSVVNVAVSIERSWDADILIAREDALVLDSTDALQLESKFKHAADFGVTEPRGTEGFQAFEEAVSSFVDDPATTRVAGTYRGDPAVLNYNAVTRQVVVQQPSGAFVTGFQMSRGQLANVIARQSLGGG